MYPALRRGLNGCKHNAGELELEVRAEIGLLRDVMAGIAAPGPAPVPALAAAPAPALVAAADLTVALASPSPAAAATAAAAAAAPAPAAAAATAPPATGAAAEVPDAPTPDSGVSGRHRACKLCSATSTPVWRQGPSGPNTLCNACGLTYSRWGGAN
jgi:hypothetical protein